MVGSAVARAWVRRECLGASVVVDRAEHDDLSGGSSVASASTGLADEVVLPPGPEVALVDVLLFAALEDPVDAELLGHVCAEVLQPSTPAGGCGDREGPAAHACEGCSCSPAGESCTVSDDLVCVLVGGQALVDAAGCWSKSCAGEDVVSSGVEPVFQSVQERDSDVEELGWGAGGHIVKWPDVYRGCGKPAGESPDGCVGAVCLAAAGDPSGRVEAAE